MTTVTTNNGLAKGKGKGSKKDKVVTLSQNPKAKWVGQDPEAGANLHVYSVQAIEEFVKSEKEVDIKEETKKLFYKMAETSREVERREVRNQIVEMNMALVTQVIRKYGTYSEDKFQNGAIGLLKAADTYKVDNDKGYNGTPVPFHNYAAFCIETEIRLAWKKQNRMFESKHKGYLDSLDDITNDGSEDRETSKHDVVGDIYAEMQFEQIIEESGIDFLFYEIIIPSIEEYGVRSKDMDMALWQELEIQYFLELSMEASQRKRLTFTEMANRLGTVTPNIRGRHKKVLARIQERCLQAGYTVYINRKGQTRIGMNREDEKVKSIKRGGSVTHIK